MPIPELNAYSIESSIAEKLEAIARNGFLNRRYKDFYDIYVLSQKNSFEFLNLHQAVQETVLNRKTPMTMNMVVFQDEFFTDKTHQERWNSFLKKKKAVVQVSLKDVILRIRSFVKPLFENGLNANSRWNNVEGNWK